MQSAFGRRNAYLRPLGHRRRGGFFGFFQRIFSHLDPVIFLCTTFLSLSGLLSLYGGMEDFGKSRLLMQTAMTAVGLALMVAIANFDFRYLIDRFWIFLLGGTVLLLVYTLLFGRDIGTNRSWIVVFRAGATEITIQPSEFVKLAFIASFAKHLTLVGKQINRPLPLLTLLLHAGLVAGLILLSGDLGVALVYLGIILIMLFVAGMSLFYDLGGILLLATLFPFLWEHMEEYQRQRILVGFNPRLDPIDKGYQPLLSRDGIISGGFFGEGLSGGEIYKILPASHTDFMFSTFAEKFGFVGGALVILAYALLVSRILFLALRLRDRLSSLIACGIAGMLIVQITENLGMCMAVLPVVGITLPFVSYGGSSILAIYLLFGLLHSVLTHGK